MKIKTKHTQRFRINTQFARIQKLAVRQTESRALFFRQYEYCLQNLGITYIAYSFLPLHEMPNIFRHFMKCRPEGRPGMSDVPSCLESQGCHLIPLSYLLSCFVFLPSPLALSFLSFFLLMVHSPDFLSRKLSNIFR